MANTKFYTTERNAQIVISLLKSKGIKRVIASPGTTNISVVGSMMNDSHFIMYSAPDERSAAYMACGMAADLGEPVVVTCTGATASRNYLPGLTEAYYRKLPVIALTSSLHVGRSGHLYPQFIDRTQQPVDSFKYSTQIYPIHSMEDEWQCVVKVNEALLELSRNGGGPVHINLMTVGEFADFSVKVLPAVCNIQRYCIDDGLPIIDVQNVGIFIGSHTQFTQELQELIDTFCSKYNAVVFCDHTSGYKGQYRVLYAIAAFQSKPDKNIDNLDLLIHIGEVSGDYYTQNRLRSAKSVWRVNEDGQIRDYFRHVTKVFQMSEMQFFSYYASGSSLCKNQRFLSCQKSLEEISQKMPQLPFSNIWIASVSHSLLPEKSKIHFGILNSLRSWNFFEIPNSVQSYCNVGGFGIDGILSTVLGASLASPQTLFFAVLGDLAFFYDMNSLANRHRGNNLRIMLINNGKGTEFRNYSHPGSKFEDRADDFIAAGGHYGNKSRNLVKHYAEDLGFKYLCAKDKEEYLEVIDTFFANDSSSSIILEIFTNNEDESNALLAIHNILTTNGDQMKNAIKSTATKLLGEQTIKSIRRRLS